ncbi:MAG TPA: hypothetical protein PLN13_09310 [Bacteroidia bacterium]|nr:hypothetical protein [Bacteroidia bacterium]HRH08766.1 hypothetical protein [Bacteroidia bacterium]
MLHSHSVENEKFGLFILFLNHLLSGEKKYEETINNVLIETRALVKGEKDVYTVNRDTFPIIIYLSKRNKTFFESLPNTKSFDKQVYTDLFSLLDRQRPISII